MTSQAVESVESKYMIGRKNPLTGDWLMHDKRYNDPRRDFYVETKTDVKRVIRFVDNIAASVV